MSPVTLSVPPSSLSSPTASHDPIKLVTSLTSKIHLQREKALALLRTSLPIWAEAELAQAKSALLPLLDTAQPWETLYGALKGVAQIVEISRRDDDFSADAMDRSTVLISHTEARVRAATSALLGALAKRLGPSVWHTVSPLLRRAVRDNLKLDEAQRLREAARLAEQDLDHAAADAKLHGLRMVHETEGWRGLETSLLALADLVEGCGREILVPAAGEGGLAAVEGLEELVEFIILAKDHPNRFVREAGLKLLNSIAKASQEISVGDGNGGVAILLIVTGQCRKVILEGLQDNWSQVRFAASVAIRTVLQGLPVERRRELYPDLLPRMCLNRHYVAEGVRNLSLDTWRNVIAPDGRKYLLLGLDKCISYYETQCEADNHAVREAACQGLGELCAQLSRDAIEPFVARIIGALVECLKDESWPVRDHACRALGGVVASFPQAAESSGRLQEVHELFEKHLADNIPSVRSNCAGSLTIAVAAFDEDHAVFGSKRAIKIAVRLLERLEHQPEQHFGAPDSRDRDTGYGAASKLARDNDAALHTDQTTYSCGSLAPKLRRGAGCMDHGFTREKLPWEEADGGLRLWTALVMNGVTLAWEAMEAVVRAGEVGLRLDFAQDMRVRQGWLECFSDAVARKGALEEGLVDRVVLVVERCRKMENQGVRAAAANCARVMRRVVGLAAYARAERAVAEKQ